MAAKCGALLPFAASAAVCACNEAFTAAAAIFPSSTNMLQKYPKMTLHKSIFFLPFILLYYRSILKNNRSLVHK
jgi:hypothetical protein